MGPPLSSSARKKKFVEKLKLTGNYEAFKQKRAEYEKARRQRLKESLALLSASERTQVLRHGRLQSLARVQKWREKKRQASDPLEIKSEPVNPSKCENDFNFQNEIDTSVLAPCEAAQTYSPKSSNTNLNFEHSFSTHEALLKAVTKARQALPTALSERKAVIAKLLYSLDEISQKEIFLNKATVKRTRTGHKRISPSMIQKIHKFYERDDISRMSTNVEDFTNFVNPTTGEEQLIRLRYLVYTLKQAYDLFMNEHSAKARIYRENKRKVLENPMEQQILTSCVKLEEVSNSSMDTTSSFCKSFEEEASEQHISSSCSPYSQHFQPGSDAKINFKDAFKTLEEFEKAVAKVECALPLSPSKRKAVVATLFYDLDEGSQSEIYQNRAVTKKPGHKRIAASLIQKIRNFYQRDDISRISAHAEDLVNVIHPSTGRKELLQLRYLVHTLKQAYALFINENSEASVSLAKFCSLRPMHVKLCKDFDVTSMLQIDFTENISTHS
ncbi:hypothetical protein Bhyg_01288 [Pseudolycoriella hygida]|uniref:Uncharacterized protein n=1 Tax=Pseudolycoriella hygida TaxID=35572 RepID=A0A9Q0N9K3_9DIPT|nr:hypothetical protein Bhyg_01288 [Pseudolycoriella hygida]